MTKTDAEIYDALMAAGVKPGMLVLMDRGTTGFCYVVDGTLVRIILSEGSEMVYRKADPLIRVTWPIVIQEVFQERTTSGAHYFRASSNVCRLSYPAPATPLSGKTCKLEVDGVTYSAKLEVV